MIDKIVFPTNCSKEEGLTCLIRQTEAWILSAPMQKLLSLYGFDASVKDSVSADEYISKIDDFASRSWDFRNGAERFAIRDDQFELDHREELAALIEDLLVPGTEQMLEQELSEYTDLDWIVILGGNCRTNRNRTLISKRFYDGCRLHGAANIPNVIGLSAERTLDISEERPEDQKTEFDNLTAAIEEIYGLDPASKSVDLCDNFDLLLEVSPDMRDWGGKNLLAFWHMAYWRCGLQYRSLSAPDDPEGRRADTIGTVKFFMNICGVRENSNVLLVSSSRYRISTICRVFNEICCSDRRNINFYFTGNVGAISPKEQIRSYLQEIRASIEEIRKLRTASSGSAECPDTGSPRAAEK